MGELWGQHVSPSGDVLGEVVRVSSATSMTGPAENAFVYVEIRPSEKERARYISWINYFDIEHANRQQAGSWRVVEPQQARAWHLIEWQPYGWGGPSLPNVAYTSM
jgi:hypothetical protein